MLFLVCRSDNSNSRFGKIGSKSVNRDSRIARMPFGSEKRKRNNSRPRLLRSARTERRSGWRVVILRKRTKTRICHGQMTKTKKRKKTGSLTVSAESLVTTW